MRVGQTELPLDVVFCSFCGAGKARKSSDSHSAESAEVFCDLDHRNDHNHGGGRRRSSGGTTHSLPSLAAAAQWNERPPRRSGIGRPGGGHRHRRRRSNVATSVAGSFRPADTGQSPSRIDTTDLAAAPPPARRGIATSTALDDQLELSPAGDHSSSSLRHSVASPPLEELVQTTLQRSDRDDGFGFSLSNGVYDSGIYVGAVKEKGPAADKLQPYDRILKVRVTFRFCCIHRRCPQWRADLSSKLGGGRQDQSGQVIKLFQTTQNISFTFHF